MVELWRILVEYGGLAGVWNPLPAGASRGVECHADCKCPGLSIDQCMILTQEKVGVAIAAAGGQVITTVLVTYAVDCHTEHSASIGAFVNVVRQTWAFIG